VPGYGGILKTMNISSTGEFNASSVKMICYDAVAGYEPSLINITGSTVALAYRGPSNQGILKTFNITTAGDISDTGMMMFFEPGSGYEPCLLQVSGKVYGLPPKFE
jgi:hypothetical protein